MLLVECGTEVAMGPLDGSNTGGFEAKSGRFSALAKTCDFAAMARHSGEEHLTKGMMESRPAAGSRMRTRSIVLSAISIMVLLAAGSAAAEVVKTGISPTAFDQPIQSFMQARAIPAASVAVIANNRLVVAAGYRNAALQGVAVQPTSRFRIASLSKPITALAILQLVESGAFSLDTAVSEILEQPFPVSGRAITVRDLLQHAGGWNRELTVDPAFRVRQIAAALQVASPATATELVSHAESLPLSHPSGSQYQYSNYGYIVLGRIVEKVSGMAYADYVRRHVFEPAGVQGAYIGSSLRSLSALGEMPYLPRSGTPARGASVFDQQPGQVPVTYGTFAVESFDSAGGWVLSAVDLARFLLRFDGDPTTADLIGPEMGGQARARPAFLAPGINAYYGLGWFFDGNQVRTHSGGLVGTATIMSYDPRSRRGYVILTNTGLLSGAEYGEMGAAVQAGISASGGLSDDLFGQFEQSAVSACQASSAWYDASKVGQGYSLRSYGEDANQIMSFWFSHAPAAPIVLENNEGHFWLIGVGDYASSTANMRLYYSSGGAFDSEQLVTTSQTPVGSLEILFDSPTSAVARYFFQQPKRYGTQELTLLVRPTCG